MPILSFSFTHVLTMPSSSVRKSKLYQRIEDEGFQAVFPCERCIRLHRSCIKSENSGRCSECVKANGASCKMPEPSFSDAEWKRLVKAQNTIEEEEEVILAKLLRLRKQKRLLQKRAGDFIARDIKEIEELEELERQEQKEREAQEKLRHQETAVSCSGASASNGDVQLAAVSGLDPSLTQLMDDPSFWVNFDPSAGGTVEPAGGSPSNSR